MAKRNKWTFDRLVLYSILPHIPGGNWLKCSHEGCFDMFFLTPLVSYFFLNQFTMNNIGFKEWVRVSVPNYVRRENRGIEERERGGGEGRKEREERRSKGNSNNKREGYDSP